MFNYSCILIFQPLVPDFWNGEGRGYLVQYKLKTQDFFRQTTQVPNENANSFTFANLEEWTEYDVRVAAFNSVGDSAYSTIATDRTIESVPSSGPSRVNATALSSSTIIVKWTDIPALEQNGEILGFKVYFSAVKNGQAQEALVLQVNDPSARETILAQLDKYTQYLIKVAGYSRIGDGVASNPAVVIRTNEDGKYTDHIFLHFLPVIFPYYELYVKY